MIAVRTFKQDEKYYYQCDGNGKHYCVEIKTGQTETIRACDKVECK